MTDANPMRDIMVGKVTLNIGVGTPGEKLDNAAKLLHMITSMKAVHTKTEKRIPAWGLRKNLQIATKITVRKAKAIPLLKRLLTAVGNKLPEKKFDDFGSFSFGVPEYIDIPGVDYQPEIGIIGMDVAVTLERKGYRVKRRRLQNRRVGHAHQITREEAKEFMRKAFNTEVEEKE
ncbi:MAG TPA: 50S ribosomal protein L5 [Candidatus Nanoarchaeia archaeon]|nr:50S ribosomal protein L5 [Candidatus Nanoarchaeia archaeon]